MFIFFFFQAEDGIRDVAVTGVQTCALPILGRETEQRKLFLQTAQFHALTGLNPEQHLADEISQRLAETGGEFASEAGELGFQTRTNFAMLHRGRLQGRSGFFCENPSTTDSVPSHLSEMINLSPSITCTRLQQKLRKVLKGDGPFGPGKTSIKH